MDIVKHMISCGMGQSNDWASIFDDVTCKNLNEIGYTGKLNGVKMSLFDYINTLGTEKTHYKLVRSGGNSFEFTDNYDLIVVKI